MSLKTWFEKLKKEEEERKKQEAEAYKKFTGDTLAKLAEKREANKKAAEQKRKDFIAATDQKTAKNAERKAEVDKQNKEIAKTNKKIDEYNTERTKALSKFSQAYKDAGKLNTLQDYEMMYSKFNNLAPRADQIKSVKYKEDVDFGYIDFGITDTALKEKEFDDRTAEALKFLNSTADTYKKDKNYSSSVKKGYEALTNKQLTTNEYEQNDYIEQLNQSKYKQEKYAWDNASKELKDNYAYIVGKYGKDSKQATDALDQINYKYGQQYEQKIADKKLAEQKALDDQNFSYLDTPESKAYYENLRKEQKNVKLVGQGFVEGAKDVVTGIKTSFDVLQDHVTSPQVVNHNRIVWETELSKSPQSVQILANISRTVGNIGTIVATSLLTGGVGGAVGANVTMGVSVFGNQFDQNIKEGKGVMESIEHAALTAGSEVLLTRIAAATLGTIRGLSTIEPQIKQVLSKIARTPKTQSMLDAIGRMLGEGTEEYVQQILTPVLRNMAFNEDNDFEIYTPDAMFAFFLGAITAGFIDTIHVTATKVKSGESNTQYDLAQQIAQDKLGMQGSVDSDSVIDAVFDELSSQQKVWAIKGLDLTQEENIKLQKTKRQTNEIVQENQLTEAQNTPLTQAQSEENITTQVNTPIENKTAQNVKVNTKQDINTITNKYEKADFSKLSAEEIHEDYETIINTINENAAQEAIKKSPLQSVKDNFNYEEVKIQQKTSALTENIKTSKLIKEEYKPDLLANEKITTYLTQEGYDNALVTKALTELQSAKSLSEEVKDWVNLPNDRANDFEQVKGIVFWDMFQQMKEPQLAAQIAEIIRIRGTSSGRATQVLTILNKADPMTKVAEMQNALKDAQKQYEKDMEFLGKKIGKNKSDKFNFTKEEMHQILQLQQGKLETNDVDLQNHYEEEIQKLVYRKMPSSWRNKIKSWNRISMMLNPKTLISRNALSNVINVPIKLSTDIIGSFIDQQIVKTKSGEIKLQRTVGNSMEGTGKAAIGGLKGAVYDLKNDTQTGLVPLDKLEKGNNYRNDFDSKALNKVNRFLSFLIEMGDRPFAEAYFIKSLTNQMKLNNVEIPTQQMIDVAKYDALVSTWQDTNSLTKMMSKLVNVLNGGKSFGWGTLMQPFVKTPMNLVKMTVQLSPVGFAIAAKDMRVFNTELQNGNYDMMLQRKAVDSISKAILGTILTMLTVVLNKAGLITGGEDDDEDVANYEKYVLNKQPYSFKIGDKYYTYSWAQPIGSSIALSATLSEEITRWLNKDDNEQTGTSVLKTIGKATTKSFSEASDLLFEQSMFKTLNTLFESEDMFYAISDVALQLPVQATPTFLSQVAQVFDDTVRQTYESGDSFGNSLRKVQAKIPVLSKYLAPSVDVTGDEIKRYGGKSNPLYYIDVFLNPASVSNGGEISPASEEIYSIYQQTNDNTVIPRTADYIVYYTKDGVKQKYTLSTEDRAEYQKIMGQGVNNEVSKLLSNSQYKSLDNTEKVKVITNIMDYYSAEAKKQLVEGYGNSYEYSSTVETANYASKAGISIGNYMVFKYDISQLNAKNSKGETVSGLKKKRVAEYLNSTNLSYRQKLLLFGLNGYSLTDSEKTTILNYINSLNLSTSEKKDIFNKLEIK